MNTPAQPTVALAMRSYSGQVELHHHNFPQIVLPQSGAMEIEVDGRGGKVDASQGVVIAPGARHSFLAERRNTFLVLDLDSPGNEAPLADSRFFAIDPQIRHLLGYASHSGALLSSSSPVASAWSALLLACLARPTPSAPQRQTLVRALTYIEQHLGSPLSARAIAQAAGSASAACTCCSSGTCTARLSPTFRPCAWTAPSTCSAVPCCPSARSPSGSATPIRVP